MICMSYDNIVIVVLTMRSLTLSSRSLTLQKTNKTCLEMHAFTEEYRLSASVILPIENGSHTVPSTNIGTLDKYGCENKSALFILLIFHSQNSQNANL